jgi:hypothetical protein
LDVFITDLLRTSACPPNPAVQNIEGKQMLSNPFFVVGAERSGTTVFRLMLDNHPELSVCPEFEYVVDPLVGRSDWPNSREFREQLASDWVFLVNNFDIHPELSFTELANSFLSQHQQRSGGRLVGAVVHRNFDQLSRIWPDARYIHLVRDPRDVARSVVNMGWAGNVWRGVGRWLDAERVWDSVRANLDPSMYCDVRYEELVLEPERTLKTVCDFLGVSFSSEMLYYPGQTTYQPPDAKLVEQWRRKQTRKEISLVEAQAADLMTARGYHLHGEPGYYPSPLTRVYLKIQDKMGRVQFRIQRLGPSLYIRDLLSRRLHLTTWQSRLEPELREVWKSSLK